MPEYEYEDYVYKFRDGQVSLDQYNLLEAKEFFWQDVQAEIRSDIKRYQDQGGRQ